MAKTKKKAVPENASEKIHLIEYCKRLSMRDRRVELIAGFHAQCGADAVVSNTEQAFDRLFDEFINRPA